MEPENVPLVCHLKFLYFTQDTSKSRILDFRGQQKLIFQMFVSSKSIFLASLKRKIVKKNESMKFYDFLITAQWAFLNEAGMEHRIQAMI